jgi:hypothetical protein
MAYARKKPDAEDDAPDAAEVAELKEAQRVRLVEKIAQSKADTEKREERFIALLQAAMEIDLADCREYDLKERNALYANCVRFLAVIGKFTDGDGDGSFFDD